MPKRKDFYKEPHCVNCRFWTPTEGEHGFDGPNICLNSDAPTWGNPTDYTFTCEHWMKINWDRSKASDGTVRLGYTPPALPKTWMEKLFGKRRLKRLSK